MSVSAFYDALAPRYDAVRFGTPYARWADGLERDFIRRHCPPGRVLELGAGTGRLTATLAAIAADVTAVDASAEMLRVLEARLAGARNVRVHRGSALDIGDLPSFGRFDAVVSFRLLPHLEDIGGALELVQRALRPGGTAVFDLWGSRSLYYALRTAARRGRVHTRFLPPRRMTDLVAAAGLRIVACRGWGFLLPFRRLVDRLDEPRAARLCDAVERLGQARLPSAAHAFVFACAKPES